MNKYILITIFLFSTVLNSWAAPQPSFNLEKLDLTIGMKRSVLEANIANYTIFKSEYNAQYPNSSSVQATYSIDSTLLTVTFKKGAPAPYINNDGYAAHLPAIEQTVLSWGIDE